MATSVEIIQIVLSAIISIAMIFVGRYLVPFIKLKIGERQAEILVKAAQQMFNDMTGKEKLEKVTKELTEYLKARNINFTEDEIRYLIEAAVRQMKEDENK